MSIEWAKDSINYTATPGGDPFRRYEIALGVKRENITGRVLDLGAGSDCKPADELRGVQVFSLSPDFSSPRNLSRKGRKSSKGKVCAGLGQQLPFADNSFDTVLGQNVIDYIEDKGVVVSEAIRVLKPGGRAYFGPDIPRPDDEEFDSRDDITIEPCGVFGVRPENDSHTGRMFECTRTIVRKSK